MGVGFVGERVEVGDREVSFRERPSLIGESSCCIPGVLDGLSGLVSVKQKSSELSEVAEAKNLGGTHHE